MSELVVPMRQPVMVTGSQRFNATVLGCTEKISPPSRFEGAQLIARLTCSRSTRALSALVTPVVRPNPPCVIRGLEKYAARGQLVRLLDVAQAKIKNVVSTPG